MICPVCFKEIPDGSVFCKRKAQLNQGNYYLVLRDTSLGILSARASDISVKVVLNP